MKFIGRTRQLKQLENELNNDRMSFALIYGRRRIGKSELIKQALKDCQKKSLYYECKQVSEKSNVNAICELLSEHFNLPKLGLDSIEEVLDYLFKAAEDEKLVLVLDEYPYLREGIKGMDSILQAKLDQYRDTSRLTIVILGSYVEIMKSLLEHSNPLFGRVDLVINLQQMDFYDSALFYPNFSAEDKIRIYSVFGGIPYYNRLIDDRKTVKENIIELISAPGARLENEVTMYLKSEIAKITNANEVIDALSRGYSKFSDILTQSHVTSSPTLADILNKLIKMEIVEKSSPINDENNKKKNRYSICDNLSLFYYRYIFKYSSQQKIMDEDVFYNKYIAQNFEEDYVPHRFETICRQYLIRKNQIGQISPVIEKIGKYYYDDPVNHRNGEFDVVTLDEKGYVFYEVKFRKARISKAIIYKEIEQVKSTELNPYKYVFISRSGFDISPSENLDLIDLADLFELG
ncbi:ATP-binding protein [Succinivibrio sp.]|uniref:ATP-binding protein n=1 Tax=Succinivibrio sp. TaxID=2053619 RepID=UPI0025F98046|nr:ATP-binding protein [Succinivibrio sp.]MBQ9220355.1 ATP-binding protein [Succinivibrio sp.]